MTEAKQEWGKRRKKRAGTGRGDWGGCVGKRIKGVLRKGKDEKVMKDCWRAQVGKRAGLSVYIYLLPQESKQNHRIIRLWQNMFLRSSMHKPRFHPSTVKKRHLNTGWFSGQTGCTDIYWLLFTWTIVLVCTHTDAYKWSQTTYISWTDRDHVFGSAMFMVPDSRCCSVSWLLCSLIDWTPLLGLSN